MSRTDPVPFNVTYTYDDLDRLISVSGTQNQTLAYDALGRMTHNSRHGDYSYGDASSVHAVTAAGSKSYTYDANGNMLTGDGRTLSWDADNRLTSVTKGGVTTSFAYDPRGNRVLKTVPGAGATLYFGKLLEINPNGEHVARIMAGNLMVAKRVGAANLYYHTDHLGSVRLITDENGNVVREADYAAFGETLTDTNPTADDRGFGGHTTDAESGLVYMNARYYDAALGRFISADSLVPETHNPQALDRYAYAYNNPISNIDPSGHGPVVAAVAAVVASATVKAVVTWVVKKAITLVIAKVVSKIIDNPVFNTVLNVMSGFASGGFLGAAYAAATSPLSPLSPKLKQSLGWAYNAFNTIRTTLAYYKPDTFGDRWGDPVDIGLKVKDPSEAWNGMPIELTGLGRFKEMVGEKDLSVLLFGPVRSASATFGLALGGHDFTLKLNVNEDKLTVGIHGGWERLLSTVVLDKVAVNGSLVLTHMAGTDHKDWNLGLNVTTTLTSGIEKALSTRLGDRPAGGLIKKLIQSQWDFTKPLYNETFEWDQDVTLF
jgi:RHS repeat-associated protein